MYRISFETNTGLFWDLHRALFRQIEGSFGMFTRFFRDIHRAFERCAGLFWDIHSALLGCAQGSFETQGSFGTGTGLFWDWLGYAQGSLETYTGLVALYGKVCWTLLRHTQCSVGLCTGLF